MNARHESRWMLAASVLMLCATISTPAMAQNGTRTAEPSADRAQLAETQRQHDALTVHRIRQPKGKPAVAARTTSIDDLQRLKHADAAALRESALVPQTPLAIRADSTVVQRRRKGASAVP
jgi:imidazolonepropionase-like amidohydrolase